MVRRAQRVATPAMQATRKAKMEQRVSAATMQAIGKAKREQRVAAPAAPAMKRKWAKWVAEQTMELSARLAARLAAQSRSPQEVPLGLASESRQPVAPSAHPSPLEEDLPWGQETPLHDTRNDVDLGSVDDASARIDVESVCMEEQSEYRRYAEILREIGRLNHVHKRFCYII